MGKFLHRLGAFAFAHPWQVIGSWVVILAILGFTAATFMQPASQSISIPGTKAQVAIDRANELFPGGGKGTGRIVFQAQNGTTIEENEQAITALLDKVEQTEGVAQVAGPFDDASFIAENGTIAYAQVQLDSAQGSTSKETISSVESAIDTTRSDDLRVEMGGDLINQAPGEILGIGEVAGVLFALVVLVITLGSLVAAGMPLVTALLGIGISMAGLFSLSQVITINTTTPVLAIMLGLAVGIDYSLFIINKYRNNLLEGYSYKDASARSVGKAGSAVVFAAATVVIALASLSIVNIPFMTNMGLAGAASIAVAALVAISVTPALLGVAGKHVVGRKTRVRVEAAQAKASRESAIDLVKQTSSWYKWGAFISRHPVPILLSAIALVAVIALPARDLTLGLPTDQYASSDTTQRQAYDLLSEGFGAGFNGPLTVVVEGLPAVSQADKDAVRSQAMSAYEQKVASATAQQQAAFQQKLASATTPEEQYALQQEAAAAQAAGQQQQVAALAQIDQTVEQYAKYVQLRLVANKVAKLDNVQQVMPALVVDNGTAGIIQVIPKSAPADQATKDLITSLRDPAIQATVSDSGDVTFAVTGSTALQEDISAKLATALPQYLLVVIGLSLILLILAFRSILVPLKATLGFLLSVLAMFGALVIAFQWGWFGITDAPGPIVSFLPIISIGILFGLAMDYEFFLVSGMHEAYGKTKDAKQSVVNGFAVGSKVVTAAAVIMVSVFAGFITNHDSTIQAMGFALAVGILVDAFIVRMTIVPAIMTLLGKSAWWLPSWIDRWLPHVSIEGDEK